MNGNCQTCPVESQCAYPYKPTDCCDQRKFRPMKAATTMPNSLDREQFEQWYACNAFDYARDPIGSRDCGLQWAAWQAGAAAERQKINAEHASKVPHAEMEKLQSAVKVLRDRSAP